MARMRRIEPSASRARTSAGSESSVSTTAEAIVVVDQAAPQGLVEAHRRLGDLLEQEVREVATVDVAGGDGRGDDVVLADGKLGAVVGDALDALERAGPVAVEQQDLAAAGVGVVGVRRRLAVHPHVPAGLLDQPVGLGGDHVGVAGQADVQRLARAAQRQRQAVRPIGDGGGDGDRPFERRHRGPEGLEVAVAGGDAPRHQRGDHLGVGGDLGRDLQTVGRLQIGEVVDVAVEGSGHEGAERPAGPRRSRAGGRWPRR